MSKRKTTLIIFLIIVGIALLFISGIWVNDNIIRPSRISVHAACDIEIGEAAGEGITILGAVIVSKDDQNRTIITKEIFVDTESVRKHEQVHFAQFTTGRFGIQFPSGSCNHRFQKFLGEVEANVGIYIPNSLFKAIYGDF